ncbi:ABC transporter permease subunit [Paenibacillus sp. HWE-109]|uniref:ABC transporter permease n=1 Tax=Paenibacillus sp. HWE-109 TaxID=1306526 RepID=UPI001EDD779C|nr:ABC transporter permease subunit [Paenibacillus sp. HWE-109]UKS28323.1 ABC transporter permease subunit [Paenibacillus sp. HWE-109]
MDNEHRYINRQPNFFKRVDKGKYVLLMFLPCLLYYVFFQYAPMLGIVISFKNYNLVKGIWSSEWVGLKYYLMFLQDPGSLKLIQNTFLLGIYSLLFGFAPPIMLALLLNEVKNALFKRFVQTVSYLPHFISNVVVVGMIVTFLSPSGGLINEMIQSLGYKPINFMMEPGLFRAIYVTSGVWQSFGWGSIIYLAALSAIDPTLYEAAEMDGASRWKKMWHITLPGIAPAIITLLILNVGNITQVGFEKVFLLTNPINLKTADILSTNVYKIGLIGGQISYASAVGLFASVISLVFLLGTNYMSRKITQTSLW